MSFEYRVLTLADIDNEYWQQRFQPKLYEQSLAWLQATEKYMVVHPCKLHSLWFQNELVAALPLCESDFYLGAKKLTNLSSFYSTECCLLTHIDFPNAGIFLLKELMAKNAWHVIELGPLSQNINYVVHQLEYPSQIINQQINWQHSHIESEESYFATRPGQLRSTIKRKSKQLAKLEHYYQFAESAEMLDTMFKDYIQIYEKSWKGQEYSYEFIKAMCLDALSKNKLCFAAVYIEGQPAAAQIWFVGDDCASIFKLAYDPKFKSLSIGTLLSEKITRHVVQHHHVSAIEFGMGNEKYKQDWMESYQTRLTYLIFNRATTLGFIAWFRYSILSSMKLALKRVLGNKRNDK